MLKKRSKKGFPMEEITIFFCQFWTKFQGQISKNPFFDEKTWRNSTHKVKFWVQKMTQKITWDWNFKVKLGGGVVLGDNEIGRKWWRIKITFFKTWKNVPLLQMEQKNFKSSCFPHFQIFEKVGALSVNENRLTFPYEK